LAIGYNILDLIDIYSNTSKYFKRNWFGPWLWSKYDPVEIHKKIDEIIGTITLKNGKRLSAENATLLDIHNYLNPHAFISDDKLNSAHVYLKSPEFTDDNFNNPFCPVKRKKVLLITAYNVTKDMITVFNTSNTTYWGYLIADVLKATMAAPTFFPTQNVSKRIIENDCVTEKKSPSEIFVDGGIFANDPELIALWTIRMQWRKLINYHLLSIGTGAYNTSISSSNLGGYVAWLFNNGLLINTLMQATCSLTEVISNNLAKFDYIKRMKFNYELKRAMSLDDPNFVKIFDEAWKTLKTEDNFQTLKYFYETFIEKEDH
jgi:hypothetical protein